MIQRTLGSFFQAKKNKYSQDVSRLVSFQFLFAFVCPKCPTSNIYLALTNWFRCHKKLLHVPWRTATDIPPDRSHNSRTTGTVLSRWARGLGDYWTSHAARLQKYVKHLWVLGLDKSLKELCQQIASYTYMKVPWVKKVAQSCKLNKPQSESSSFFFQAMQIQLHY